MGMILQKQGEFFIDKSEVKIEILYLNILTYL